MIAENGFGQIEELDSEHKLHDDYRIDYIKEHIRALQKAYSTVWMSSLIVPGPRLIWYPPEQVK